MADPFKTDPGLNLMAKSKDPDALVDGADACILVFEVNYHDFVKGVELGMLAAKGQPIWRVETEDRNVLVYFVGSLEDTIRRISDIKERTDTEAGSDDESDESEGQNGKR